MMVRGNRKNSKIQRGPTSPPQTVESLGLPTRVLNRLRCARVETVDQLQRLTDVELMALEQLGPKGVAAIRQVFRR